MRLYIGLAVLLAPAAVSGALYDFEGGSYPNNASLPAPAWTISDPMVGFTSTVAGNKYGAIGTFFANPSGPVGTASAVVSSPMLQPPADPLLHARLSADISITDSVNDEEPGDDFHHRNEFGAGLKDNIGTSLIDVHFTPRTLSTNPNGTLGIWDISYTFGGGVETMTTIGLPEAAVYKMEFIFHEEALFFVLRSNIQSFAFPGTPAGYDYTRIDGSRITFSTEPGDAGIWGTNFLYFDNIDAAAAVPESSVAMLGSLVLCPLLMRRRGRSVL